MTAHDHRTIVEGCYRCELSRDELATCPECRDGKHRNCTGWTLDLDDDPTDCEFPCREGNPS